MPQISTIVLTTKGEVRKANLQLQDDNSLTMETINKYLKRKETCERICYYEYDNKVIFIFGYKTGKKDKENKTKLPPPHDEIILNGEALVIVSLNNKWENPISFTVDQWKSVCNNLNKDNIKKPQNDDDIDTDSDSDKDTISEDDDELSEVKSEKSVKDDYDDSSDAGSEIPEDDISDEELEPEPIVIKKKKATALNLKSDINNYKDELTKDSLPETNKLRMLCIKSFNFLEDNFSSDNIRHLEQSVFEATLKNAERHFIPKNWKSPQFTELYRQIIRSIISNIHPKSPVKNPRLLNRIQEGEFNLEELASMTSYEMFPEKWFMLRDKQLQREQKILEGNKSRATDQFKCRRCNKRECTYYELQTRSADEPMTIFITCLNCGKEWRQGG